MKELELYVHIPFCVKKCAYCDFLSGPSDEDTKQAYVDALCEEIKGHRDSYQEYKVTTIFMGGGTPSILKSEQMEQIFLALRESFLIAQDAEITIEVNPGTADLKKAEVWKALGINRISIGLQSVKDQELKMLGRIHTFAKFLETYQLLRQVGFENINVDLISAIPGQTVESYEETLRTIAELNPEHISAYSLIIEEGTPFYEMYAEDNEQAGLLPLPDEDAERKMYEDTERILQEYGYHRYEISNYAKEGYACRHNIGYWRRTEYLGMGLGASSLIGKKRLRTISDLQSYQQAVQTGQCIYEEEEMLRKSDEMEEFMFLGLRMMDGIRCDVFEACFGMTMEAVYGDVLLELARNELIVYDKNQIRLTKRGIDISNAVFEQFLLDDEWNNKG